MESTDWRLGLRRDEGVAGYAFRVTTICTAIAGGIFGSLGFLDLLTETALEDMPVALVLFVLLVAPPLGMGVLALSAPGFIVRRVALIYGLGYLVVLAGSALFGPAHVDPHGEAWIISITSIPAASAMLAVPRPMTWLYLPALGVLSMAVAVRSASSQNPLLDGIIVGLYDATFSAIFVGLVFVALVWTRRLDERIAVEAHAEAESLAAEARGREQQRFEALVHDSLISTLLVAAQGSVDARTLAQNATVTLGQFGEPEDAVPSIAELVGHLRADVHAENPEVRWRETVTGELVVPPMAIEALRGATLEAIRNAARHAARDHRTGRPAEVDVELNVDEERISVAIRDNGRGFVVERVPAERLGVRYSIVERMRTVGGSATIESTLGAGTTVLLRWEASRV
ncbi:MAG TPA: ATP-binding protein [Microbacteriaceae bacterium]|nr:ATP-binding protein [Microbacteriaceae bacterium]